MMSCLSTRASTALPLRRCSQRCAVRSIIWLVWFENVHGATVECRCRVCERIEKQEPSVSRGFPRHILPRGRPAVLLAPPPRTGGPRAASRKGAARANRNVAAWYVRCVPFDVRQADGHVRLQLDRVGVAGCAHLLSRTRFPATCPASGPRRRATAAVVTARDSREWWLPNAHPRGHERCMMPLCLV